ncbi:MAG: sodium-dependent bicarbonate transport family permease, partial [Spirochaetota bacterium]
ALLRSDLKIPDAAGAMISVFILASIGLRAGVAVNKVGIVGVILPSLLAVFTGILTVSLAYCILIRTTNVGMANAASIAGHYGAVSSVTLAVAIVYIENTGTAFEAFVPALYPFMDTAALVTAVALSRTGMTEKQPNGMPVAGVIRETVASKVTLLLLGCFFIGYINGEPGTRDVMPVFSQMFPGVLAIFMLDIGIIAGSRLSHLLTVDWKVFAVGLVLPPLHGFVAVVLATVIGLSPGGATVFAALAAGASYISAPAVMRASVPEANPSLSLAMALGLAFPFNVTVGIPLYHRVAQLVTVLF